MPFFILLDESFNGAIGPLEEVLDGANTFDEVLLSLAAWLFAFQPLKLCFALSGVPLECFTLGIKLLELLKAWEPLEPLGVLALLIKQPLEQVISMLTWWQFLPCNSSSSLDKHFMDLLAFKKESFMQDPVDTWFQRESASPCRCCGLVGAHCDRFISPSETTPDMEPANLITATNEVDLPNF